MPDDLPPATVASVPRTSLAQVRRTGLPPPILAALFIAAATAPLIAAHLTGLEPAEHIPELATGFGLVACGLMFLQFLSSGRYETLSGRIGIDRTMGFHRIAALALLTFAILHPLIYVLGTAITEPEAAWSRFVGLISSRRLRTGVLALAGLIGLTLFALLKARTRVSYEFWRASHGLVAALIAGLALHHALTAGAYSPERPLVALWTGLGAVAFLAIAFVYLVRPWRMRRESWVVASSEAAGEGMWHLTLRGPPDTRFTFQAGQFIWMVLAPHRAPFHDHPFSIASAPAELPSLRLIVREAGDCTRDFGHIEPGTKVAIDGPHGSFMLNGEGRTVVMIAGGVGIAPLLGMLEHAANLGDGRQFRLLYGGRTSGALAGLARLRELERRLDLQILLFVDEVPDGPTLSRGPIQPAHIASVVGEPASTVAYVCGPPRMMEVMTDALLDLRVPPKAIHYERFDYGGGGGKIDKSRRRHALMIIAVVLAATVAFGLL